jgi:putative ABC transport system substrate-binding protein
MIALGVWQMTIVIGRRQFISALGGATLAWPLAVRAQPMSMPVIGYLSSRSRESDIPYVDAIRQGLKEVGYVEDQNVRIEYLWADGHYDRLPEMATDLVRRHVSIIVTSGGITAVLAAKAATSSIPIVFGIGGNPVELGLVASLNAPGGNITGVTTFNTEVVTKALEFLHELVPKVLVIAVLVNPKNPIAAKQFAAIQPAAQAIGEQIVILHASTEHDIDAAFPSLIEQRAGAMFISTDAFFASQRDRLASLAIQHKVPTIYASRQYAEAGGLISYAPNQKDAFRQQGIYAGEILKGAKPADLPIMQPTKYELVLNLKTAKALEIEIPPKILALADEVIE